MARRRWSSANFGSPRSKESCIARDEAHSCTVSARSRWNRATESCTSRARAERWEWTASDTTELATRSNENTATPSDRASSTSVVTRSRSCSDVFVRWYRTAIRLETELRGVVLQELVDERRLLLVDARVRPADQPLHVPLPVGGVEARVDRAG